MKRKVVRIDKALAIKEDIKFENTIFLVRSQVGIACIGCRVIFENCKIVFYRCKKANIGLFAQNAKVKITNCFIQNANVAVRSRNSSLIIRESRLSYNKEYAVSAVGSAVDIENCDICINGFEIFSAQISLENSKANILHSRITKGVNSTALFAKNSFISLDSTEILLNDASAIHLENCRFSIRKAKIYDNSLLNQDFSQVYIENSKGKLTESLLYAGKNSFVIYATKQSSLKVLNSFIFDNNSGILADRYSQITIYKTRIFRNALLERQAQINADSAKIYLVSSKVFDGFQGIYAQKVSFVFLKNSNISRNQFPFCMYELSHLVEK
ncbi:hypothetical protein DESAMIL20_1023 [Desulfurella amilsii]|uniref:Right handed beta helix domain-containing protein n=1 Tax=Desulfurella amilsii TaxID=1562698 RepID=A0A1X4XVB2_9BACT|nr:right-handed parallel beta-helix repeat-containing protein [Desulfurella amilsii]OSS41470.1 hypothetical protein DESAMIL20_1023 [Desulfurella amilsii]